MGGERLDTAMLMPGGVEGDRIWGVEVDGEIAAPEKRKICRPLPDMSSRLRNGVPQVQLSNGDWVAADSANAVDAISERLGAQVRLLPHDRLSPRYQRLDLHVLTTASLKSSESWISKPDQADARRYRPNFLVETAEGFDGLPEKELVGRRLICGEATIRIIEPCFRCALPALGLGGLVFLPELVHAVSAHSSGHFGALAKVVGHGQVSVGDEIVLID